MGTPVRLVHGPPVDATFTPPCSRLKAPDVPAIAECPPSGGCVLTRKLRLHLRQRTGAPPLFSGLLFLKGEEVLVDLLDLSRSSSRLLI